ncbi:hypothetical protein J6590_063586 [Homalodisca vitripennis]|nr:hypothetical protein J6590_063586 [Homalodisca vitripennis]
MGKFETRVRLPITISLSSLEAHGIVGIIDPAGTASAYCRRGPRSSNFIKQDAQQMTCCGDKEADGRELTGARSVHGPARPELISVRMLYVVDVRKNIWIMDKECCQTRELPETGSIQMLGIGTGQELTPPGLGT